MISKTGYWELDSDRITVEPLDQGLCTALISYIKGRQITFTYDFGCAAGKYVNKFWESGIIAAGYDGNPITANFKHCFIQDLTEEFYVAPVDFILCLEVGEHIPAEYSGSFINNLVTNLNAGGVLVLSWAVPGQGGYGHVNELTNEEVIKIIPLEFDRVMTDQLRATATISYFKNTLMVFHK